MRRSSKIVALLAFSLILLLLNGCIDKKSFSQNKEDLTQDSNPIHVPIQELVGNLVNSPQWGNSQNETFWYFINEWQPTSNPPRCPEPLLNQSPANFSLATSILYPGQVRGGDYKAHGGARFDNSTNSINIYAPMDGDLMRGRVYLVQGEPQYLFDIVNPCGIMYRFDHLRLPSEKFLHAAEKFDAPQEGVSFTTDITPIPVKSGELIATKIGLKDNVFFDFGVYDLMQKNNASKNQKWLEQHNNQLAPYAICWFNILPLEDRLNVEQLPGADSINGKSSDYC